MTASPLLSRGGVAEGRGGVVWKFPATPPRLRESMWLRAFFFIAQPPLLC
jgi:hypothetical protein